MLPIVRNFRYRKLRKQRGQTLLITLLILAVVLTIALSIASRSVTDVNISTKEEEAARAFSAAEAGIEQALIGGPTSGTLPNGATFNVTPRAIGGATGYNYPQGLRSGETAPVWFLAHRDDSTLDSDCSSGTCFTGSSVRLCWGSPGTSAGAATTPAIQLNVLYDPTVNGEYSDSRIVRRALDPNASRRGQNGFQAVTGGACSVNGQDYAFSENISFASMGIGCASNPRCLLAGRIRFFYNSNAQPFGADSSASGVAFPLQGRIIESTGASGEANRRIQVVRQYPDLPPVFDFTLFSGSGSLTKN
jgi:Tfp pilus assembly protein PilX